MEWGAAVASLLGIILLVLKQWAAKQNGDDAKNETIQQQRKDIAAGNIDVVQSRIDRLCSDADTDHSDAGIESAEDAERRISQL